MVEIALASAAVAVRALIIRMVRANVKVPMLLGDIDRFSTKWAMIIVGGLQQS